MDMLRNCVQVCAHFSLFFGVNIQFLLELRNSLLIGASIDESHLASSLVTMHLGGLLLELSNLLLK